MYLKSRYNSSNKKISNNIKRPVELSQRKYSTAKTIKKKTNPKIKKRRMPL